MVCYIAVSPSFASFPFHDFTITRATIIEQPPGYEYRIQPEVQVLGNAEADEIRDWVDLHLLLYITTSSYIISKN